MSVGVVAGIAGHSLVVGLVGAVAVALVVVVVGVQDWPGLPGTGWSTGSASLQGRFPQNAYGRGQVRQELPYTQWYFVPDRRL